MTYEEILAVPPFGVAKKEKPHHSLHTLCADDGDGRFFGGKRSCSG